MVIFYSIVVALLIVFPIAALDRDVKWWLLLKYMAETIVATLVLVIFVLFIGQDQFRVGSGDGGAIVLWFMVLGGVIAVGEILGFLRYRRDMNAIKAEAAAASDGDSGQNPPAPNSGGSIALIFLGIFSFLKKAAFIWFGLFLFMLIVDQFVFHVPDEYVEELHFSLVIVASLVAAVSAVLRANRSGIKKSCN